MRLFTLLFLYLSILTATAQTPGTGRITGSLVDSATTKPVPFATVALQRPDGQLLTGTTTDAAGAFELDKLPPGSYRLALSFVGYTTKTLPGLSLTADQPILALGRLLLQPDAKSLRELVVTGQKALVEDKGDRLVYNAEKDISNAGGTAVDVLRKVPTLSVDLNGNVQMRGNGNIRVLVNGKPSAMMARNLADALRQMPANTIKSVEVITSPGAKYDAEGSAGIINIITKKALQGFNGSVNATAGNYNRGLGATLNLKKKKLGLALSVNGYQYRNQFWAENTRTTLVDGRPVNRLFQRNEQDNTGTGANGTLSLDYDPDSLTRLNFSANIWGGNFPNNQVSTVRQTDLAGNETLGFRNDIRFRNPYGNGQLDLGYIRTFRKPEKEFSILAQFSRMPDNYFYDTDRYGLTNEQVLYRERSTNYSRNKEYTAQTDYIHPFTTRSRRDTVTFKWEIGAKAILRDIGSEFRVEQSADGKVPFVTDPLRTNDFAYTQIVYSGYTALRADTKRGWGLNAGVRLENTDIRADFITNQTKFSSTYRNLVPSLTLSKKIKTHTVKLSYTQRIQRPQIWFLNPWVNSSDPKNITIGNPYLEPELSHATELSHSLATKKGWSVNTSLYWRQTNNAIEFLASVDSAGVATNRPRNIGRRAAYGLNLNVSGQLTKDWSLNGGGDIRYLDLSSPALGTRNQGTVWNVNVNSTYKLPKNYTLQLNGEYGSGWINLQSTSSRWFWYGVSAKREFWDKKASLTLAVNTPFHRGIRQNSRQEAPTFTGDSNWFFISRQARLTFEWRFGQMNTGGKQSKKINNDDKAGR